MKRLRAGAAVAAAALLWFGLPRPGLRAAPDAAVRETQAAVPTLPAFGDVLRLQSPLSQRVHFAASTFRMGSDRSEMAQALADAGAIDPEAVELHPMRHLLTQVVGAEGGTARADLSILHLIDGDQILLCTDGLTDMVSEATIKQSLTIERPAAQGCRALVEMALDGGGRDNITVVLARYRIAQ